MFGLIISIIAGISMAIQGVFNTRVSEKIGITETNLIVQGIAFLLSIIVFFILGSHDFKNFKEVNKLYLFGGAFGVIIVYSVMVAIGKLGPTYAIAAILVAQLLTASIIESFGLFNSQQIKFSLNEFVGISLMIFGIAVFKFFKF